MKLFSYALAATLSFSGMALTGSASAAEITGAGATFPYPVYSKWAEAYRKETGTNINYQSIGSGGGIRQITAKTVDFGATDAPLKAEDLEKNGLSQFPTVMGGVVTIVNIEGLKSGELKLTGEIVADIYAGKITRWNDQKITALNSDVKLPDARITPLYRSDGSGTTNVFTTYLSQVSENWKNGPGVGTSVEWPVGQGGKGNEGVAALVKQVPNSIGYVEYAYAKQNGVPYASLQNKAGKFVKPEVKTFQAAAANADWSSTPGFGISLTNQAGDDAWPITAPTFILVHKKSDKPEQVAETVKFFTWAFDQGDKMADELDYVPLPAKVKEMVKAEWKTLNTAGTK
ncbi:phosphate ABC transporter substrate-binding protein PstS [Microvirga sp. W0021]|uniref:Phosphate-binding protein PstS n=1 Tax=Hohaiivirga grylli TaxID=3133970 RepID=A0ABV0BH66_9HYPH